MNKDMNAKNICEAFKANTTERCSQGITSGCTIDHEGHSHYVCKNHYNNKDKAWFTIDPSTCPEEKVEQLALAVPDERRQQALANIKAKLANNNQEETNMTEDQIVVADVEPLVHRIMVTGHTKLANEKHIEASLASLMEEYINTYGKENIVAVSGGALGADKLWARVAYKMGVAYEVYVPTGYEHVFIDMNRYNPKSREERNIDMGNFYKMLGYATAVFDENGEDRDPTGRYQKGANFKRNTTMVRKSQHFIAVCDTDPKVVVNNNKNGGTYHCIREMKRLNVTSLYWIPTQVTNIIVTKRVNF